MGEKKELNLDELEKVTGGINQHQGCELFIQAYGKEANNNCNNCFYYNKTINNSLDCTHPTKTK